VEKLFVISILRSQSLTCIYLFCIKQIHLNENAII
jgi:hypothetical protein